ncbi:MAG: YegS/Rv2252/BmrU family lipid kinase [Peptostreptococcaceae bacterium]|nr:YegS/Rv2252/BmrU family lipid kinase [Peptostreptococcaceae bacterium]
MKKALLAYNPMSGSRFVARNLDLLVSCFQQQGIRLTLHRISEEEELLPVVAETDAEFIIGAGGDGTISQVIASMLKYEVKLPFMALGTGTSNNFTRNIEDTRSITSNEQAKKIIEEAYQGKVQRFDVGRINEKTIFLTSLAGGNFIDTTFTTDKNLKYMFGNLAYYIKPLTEIGNMKTYPLKVTANGKVYEEDILVFVIVNGSAVGNFDNFINNADMKDGVMEMVLIKDGTPLDNLALFHSIVKGEDITAHSNVMIIKGSNFLIECEEDMPITVDGEKGPPLPLGVEVLPQAISVMVAQNAAE